MTATTADHRVLMDRIYRHQRHIYDATRKYYLLGRDRMIADLRVPAGGSVLEIGCGTGRNLVKAAKLYPNAKLYGVDISTGMLATAGRSVAAAGLCGKVRLACADAAAFDPSRTFGQVAFDRIFISYALSMIPEWQAVMRSAVAHLAPGGELHIVDFGDFDGLPRWFKAGVYRWLAAFHVAPRGDLFDAASAIAAEIGGESRQVSAYRGFAWTAVVRRT